MSYTEHPKCCMAHHFQDKNSCTCRCHHGLTHEELLSSLVTYIKLIKQEFPATAQIINALRVVVELHSPSEWGNCLTCSGKTNETVIAYPCATVKVIEIALQ